jgi:hypothetical protein
MNLSEGNRLQIPEKRKERELDRKSLLLLIPSPLLFRWNQLVLSAMGVVVIPRVIFR